MAMTVSQVLSDIKHKARHMTKYVWQS